jgi:Fic family protein
MSFTPQYELTATDVRHLELISKGDGLLQVLRMNPEWEKLLERRAGIREAIGSLGIEGTVLSVAQANAITIGDTSVSVGEKERREFVGYSQGLEFIRERIDESLTMATMLRLHELVTQGDPDAQPGKVRSDLRSVERHGRIVYTAPPPAQLALLLGEFMKWFNATADDWNFSPVVAAAICHFWFVWIHPFADGNGRVSRLLTTWMLLRKKSEGVKYFALSDYYNENLEGYYDALGETNAVSDPKSPAMNFDGSLNRWVSYFLVSYQEQMQKAKTVANRILQFKIRVDHLRKDGLISEKHEKLLAFLSGRERASYEELSSHLDVTAGRVTQLLQPLRAAKILAETWIGNKLWFELGAPENEPDESTLKRPLKRRVEPPEVGIPGIQGVLPIFEN